MIRLILTVIACVLTAMLAVFLTLNPGLVTVEFLGQTTQAPFALAMGACSGFSTIRPMRVPRCGIGTLAACVASRRPGSRFAAVYTNTAAVPSA